MNDMGDSMNYRRSNGMNNKRINVYNVMISILILFAIFALIHSIIESFRIRRECEYIRLWVWCGNGEDVNETYKENSIDID